MKRLIDVEPPVWGKVRDFATINSFTLSIAISKLLSSALKLEGYEIGNYRSARSND